MKVGITGHQDLSKHSLEWIKQSLENFIAANTIEKGYSSLAAGADQLFVKCLKQVHISYDIIVPCRKYESTFKMEDDLKTFNTLLQCADNVVILDYDRPGENAFYDAGIKIVELSDHMIAIWNGYPAKGLGGTADIVKKALDNRKEVFHINPLLQTANYLSHA